MARIRRTNTVVRWNGKWNHGCRDNGLKNMVVFLASALKILLGWKELPKRTCGFTQGRRTRKWGILRFTSWVSFFLGTHTRMRQRQSPMGLKRVYLVRQTGGISRTSIMPIPAATIT